MNNNIFSLKSYREGSHKSVLREFYFSLDNQGIHLETDINIKRKFFKKQRGRFIAIHRNNRSIGIDDIAKKFDFSLEEYISIENGSFALSDAMFFRICHFLKVDNEVSVFLEKMEEAFKPKVKEGRIQMAKAIKQQFGIQFADSSKYDTSKKGQVLSFKK